MNRYQAGVCAAVLLLASLPVAAFVAGQRLPREHRAVVSGIVAASPERVWTLMTQTASEDGWRTSVRHVLGPSPVGGAEQAECWTELALSSFLPLCTVEVQPPVRWVVHIPPWFSEYQATWTYELSPVAGTFAGMEGGTATRVTITEESDIPSPLRRFYGHVIANDRTWVGIYLRDLQAEAVRRR